MSTKNVALLYDNYRLSKTLMTGVLIALCLLCLSNVYAAGGTTAALPTGGGLGIPGTDDSAGFGKTMVSIIKWGISILAVCALGFGLALAIFKLFSLVNDARTNDVGWGPVISQMLVILLIVGVAVLFYGLINKFVFEFLDKLVA